MSVLNALCDRLVSRDTSSPFVMRDAVDVRARETPIAVPAPDVDDRSDAWLIDAVRRDPMDERALDALVARHWRKLFARCRMLTLNGDEANELAQSAWCRVLRGRTSLDPERNFGAYLSVIATNLWRDAARAARRAGPLAERRLTSLDAPMSGSDGDLAPLVDLLPDPTSLSEEERLLLATDLDEALGRLTPRHREVLIARFLEDESAAEIAKREGRSEQAVSGWVRDALADMRHHLQHWRHEPPREEIR
ncbi:MAG TPA: sigma-70 family RNA polymerase sigma factor [Gemmatimonadaceae bacterium]|nr:sigma-70 family RNA polymerase sigma factor [Gemmatimonadaceae bacterium]